MWFQNIISLNLFNTSIWKFDLIYIYIYIYIYMTMGHLSLASGGDPFEGLRKEKNWISSPRFSGLLLLWSSLGRSWGMISFQWSLRRAHIWKMPWIGNVCFDSCSKSVRYSNQTMVTQRNKSYAKNKNPRRACY